MNPLQKVATGIVLMASSPNGNKLLRLARERIIIIVFDLKTTKLAMGRNVHRFLMVEGKVE